MNAKSFTEVQEVPIPLLTAKYNVYMGGVNKLDQFISCNQILRYWKTMFYHLLKIIITNASIINTWLSMTSGQKCVSQTQFRDNLIKEIIARFGRPVLPNDSFTISHGSWPFKDHVECVHCHTNHTTRKCPHCPFQPALCHVYEKDCHSLWRITASLSVRNTWIKNRTTSRCDGPKGSKNLKKRRGNYKSSNSSFIISVHM